MALEERDLTLGAGDERERRIAEARGKIVRTPFDLE